MSFAWPYWKSGTDLAARYLLAKMRRRITEGAGDEWSVGEEEAVVAEALAKVRREIDAKSCSTRQGGY